MATNPSNSNAVNIGSLSQAQLAVDGDLLILETPFGTQTIDFQNFNVVKTDVLGNATVIGNLTAKDALLANVRVTALSAGSIHTSLGQGVNAANDYYNRFTIEDGIVLSASVNTLSDPVYTRITQTDLPTTTSYMVSLFKRVADETIIVNFPRYSTTQVITFYDFFAAYPWLTLTRIQNEPQSFICTPVPNAINVYNDVLLGLTSISNSITPAAGRSTMQSAITGLMITYPALSALPVLPTVRAGDITQPLASNNLQVTVTLPYPVPNAVDVYCRLLVTG